MTNAGLSRGRLAALLVLGAAVLVALAIRWVGRSSAPASHVFDGTTMGSPYRVTVDETLTGEQQARVRAAIEEGFGRVERLLSTFDTASEVSRFNRHASTEPFPVSVEVLDVLILAREVSERSGGALDVTVAPLVDAWGFGPTDRDETLPDEAVLAELRARVGYTRLVLDRDAGTIAKQDPALTVDLSAVGQGYAIDVVADALRRLGLARFLVELSGEMAAVGTRRDGTPWRIGIEAPIAEAPELWGTVELIDESVSTSGDYMNWVEIDGARYSHLVDPRTGRPVPWAGASVTVVHPSTVVADAWDTALAVLGPDAGYELAEREGLAALFLTREGDTVRARATSALAGRVRALPGSGR